MFSERRPDRSQFLLSQTTPEIPGPHLDSCRRRVFVLGGNFVLRGQSYDGPPIRQLFRGISRAIDVP